MDGAEAGEARFWELAQPLLDQAGVTRSTMMGFPCLRLHGDFFATCDRRNGDLVVKLDEHLSSSRRGWSGGAVRTERPPLPGVGGHPLPAAPHLGPSPGARSTPPPLDRNGPMTGFPAAAGAALELPAHRARPPLSRASLGALCMSTYRLFVHWITRQPAATVWTTTK